MFSSGFSSSSFSTSQFITSNSFDSDQVQSENDTPSERSSPSQSESFPLEARAPEVYTSPEVHDQSADPMKPVVVPQAGILGLFEETLFDNDMFSPSFSLEFSNTSQYMFNDSFDADQSSSENDTQSENSSLPKPDMSALPSPEEQTMVTLIIDENNIDTHLSELFPLGPKASEVYTSLQVRDQSADRVKPVVVLQAGIPGLLEKTLVDSEGYKSIRYLLPLNEDALRFSYTGVPSIVNKLGIACHNTISGNGFARAAGDFYYNSAGELVKLNHKSSDFQPWFKSLGPVLLAARQARIPFASVVIIEKLGSNGEQLATYFIPRDLLERKLDRIIENNKMIENHNKENESPDLKGLKNLELEMSEFKMPAFIPTPAVIRAVPAGPVKPRKTPLSARSDFGSSPSSILGMLNNSAVSSTPSKSVLFERDENQSQYTPKRQGSQLNFSTLPVSPLSVQPASGSPLLNVLNALNNSIGLGTPKRALSEQDKNQGQHTPKRPQAYQSNLNMTPRSPLPFCKQLSEESRQRNEEKASPKLSPIAPIFS